jgi:hypothetical protein
MKFARINFGLLIGLIAAATAFGQANPFNDVNVDYTFQIPDEKWKMVKSGATGGNVEFVYGDRNDGHLEVRKISSPRTTPMADVIKEQEDKLQFIPGYVAGKQENFNGKLNGSIFNYEFIKSGRAMSGRIYFLRAGDSVYLLRFTGFQDSLRSIRTHTDSIARTFEPKRS